MTLREKQSKFALLAAKLIQEAFARGYEATLGEAWRSPEQAAWNAKRGAGIAHSLHCDRLALDLLLFKDGVYLTDSDDYTALGQWWKAQSTSEILCCWGGDFKERDGNHYSVEHEGRR